MVKALVLDTETTGMDPDDRLVEIAGVKIETGWEPETPVSDPALILIEDTHESLLDPGRPIPPDAMGVHHITDEMVKGADTSLGSVIGIMLEALDIEHRLDCLVAQNAKFDRQFLDPEFNPEIPWICTYKVAAFLYPDAPNHKNATIYYYLGLHRDPLFDLSDQTLHRALPDAMITASIFHHMLQKISVNRMIEITLKPVLQKNIAFGKHTGKPWDEVDSGYINWILGKAEDFDEDVIYTARCQKIARAKNRR